VVEGSDAAVLSLRKGSLADVEYAVDEARASEW